MKKIVFSLLSLCAVGMTSCSDFLDSENRANIEADPYFQTDAGLAALRVTVFTGLQSLIGNVQLTEWGTDLYVSSKTSDPGAFHRYDITAENAQIEGFYKSVYALINNANCMIKYGARNEQYLAEAKFVRCYGYYLLMQQFGSVPYVDAYIESGQKAYPKCPLPELYDHVITELQTIADSPALPADDHAGNPSRRAVQTLLAHVCLEAGWDLETRLTDAATGQVSTQGTHYFTQAAQWADQAIGGQVPTLSFEAKWSPDNDGNAEEIFSVQYCRNGYPGNVLNGGHRRQATYGSQLGDPAITGLKNCDGSLVPSAKALYLWGKGDTRYEATFMTTMYNYFGNWPKTGYYAYYTATEAERATIGIADQYFPWYVSAADVKAYILAHQQQFVQGEGPNKCHVHLMADPVTYYEFDFKGNISSTTTPAYASYLRTTNAAVPAVKKFDDPSSVQQSGITDDYRCVPIFHLSQLYLVAAEAYLMAGDQTQSLQRLNTLRQRAGAAPLSAYSQYEPDYATTYGFGDVQLIDVILDERARELYAECTRWTDLRRTRQLVRYNVEFNEFVTAPSDMANVQGEIKWYRPLPAAEIATNTAITQQDQNPGY